MSYRCEACGAVSRPREPMSRAIEHRPDGSILKEHAVCYPCGKRIQDEGLSFDELALGAAPVRRVQPINSNPPPAHQPQGKSLFKRRPHDPPLTYEEACARAGLHPDAFNRR